MSDAMRNDPPLAAVVRDGSLRCSIEEAALILARQEYPALDPAPWLERLDDLAARVRPLLSTRPDPPEIIGAVNDILFRDEGFRGNTADYYDPRNSFLNDVIERRTGIPITLGVVYIGVARRAGLPALRGCNFPGHFLVLCSRSSGWPIVIDAFDGGRILSQQDCDHLAHSFGHARGQETPAPVADIRIVRRMLENLRSIYTERGDADRLARTVAQIRVVEGS